MPKRRGPAVPLRWRLEAPSGQADGRRVEARVAGGAVAFWSEDEALRPAVEAFAGPMLLPAMKAGARLEVSGSVDATWVLGTRTLAGVFAEWWGYPAAYPVVPASVVRDESHPAPGHGLCFTAGVDSFHALLTAASRYDHLVYVLGLDVPLDDAPRREALVGSLARIARETGKRLVLLATDVRSHPVFAEVGWERTHGAVLAAAGHVLGGRIGRLSIPPSWNARRGIPWGSHPRTDELWSTHRVRIHHADATVRRRERIRHIARYPIVQRHLRVCWENLAPTGNCSRCEKCLRTMTTLDAFGLLDRFEVFDPSPSLEARLDDLPRLPPYASPLWPEMLELDLRPPLRRALERLLDRSRPGWGARLLARFRRGRGGPPGRR